ncbi:MAG: hypothetical protein ABWY63_12430 [Hyphomicrobiaceae bacterium]|jgi:hypothetical protein
MSRMAGLTPSLLSVFLLSVLAAPVEYLAHEGGHFLAARSFGVPATLHFDHVALPQGAVLGNLQQLLFIAAGPVVDWIVGLAGLLLVLRRFTPLRLVLAVWLARPLQFLPSLIGVDLGLLGLGGSLEGADEVSLARLLNLPDHLIVWMELFAAVPLLMLVVLAIPAHQRLSVLCVMSIGVLTGWAAWLALGGYVLA